jgi:glycosyltransferase 2 family protein
VTAKSAVRLGVGVALAALFTWLLLRQLDLSQVVDAFRDATARWVIAALVAFFLGYLCRIARWHAMLSGSVPGLRLRACAGPFLASFAANNVLPFRAGDVMRVFAFNRALGTTSGVVAATLFVERLLDLLMVVVLLAAALLAFDVGPAVVAGLGSTALFAGAGVLLLVLLFPRPFAPIARGAGRLARRIAPRVGARVSEEITKGLATLEQLATRHVMLKLLGWSALAWTFEGGVFWFAALALPSVTEPQGAWLALPVATFATLIPSTPGYVGTFDYFTAWAMIQFGNAPAPAAAAAFLVHTLLWLPPTLVGGTYLLLHPARGLAAAGGRTRGEPGTGGNHS